MKIRLASSITDNSIVDGIGMRSVIWCQGCIKSRICASTCHNPQTHSMNGGFEVDIVEVKEKIGTYDPRHYNGITISGGEPFLQPKQCTEIARYAHSRGLTVWTYTGYTWEELMDKSNSMSKVWSKFLSHIDVLVDGMFLIEKKDLTLKFRGSTNQRVINVSQSLKQNKVIEIDLEDKMAI